MRDTSRRSSSRMLFPLVLVRSVRPMSTNAIPTERRSGIDWRRAEVVLTGLGILAFLTLPIRLTTIYGGLPAHPLFVHVPVVFIPVTILAALAGTARTE